MASLNSFHEALAGFVYNPQQTITETDIDNVVEPALQALTSVKLQGVDANNQQSMIHLLSELDTKVQSISTLSKQKIESIHQSILTIKKGLLTHKIDLTIAYISTSSCEDHNGVFNGRYKYLVSEKVPFVVSRSLLSGADSLLGVQNDKKKALNSDLPLLNDEEWEVFAQVDGVNNGELVVCIPKMLFEGETGIERLGKLDLKTDGSLKQIPIREAFAGPVGVNSYQDFSDLFDPSPAKTKMFYLMGHGSLGQPAGMAVEDYKAFLRFCKSQNCRGLLMLSCYSGGKSTLIPLELSKEEKETLDFPIATQSLGDWVARVEPAHEKPGRLEEIRKLFENPGALTLPRVRKILRETEKGIGKSLQNSIQIILPHSHEVPAGARAPAETGFTQSLTIADVRKEELLKSSHEVEEAAIAVVKKTSLLIFPIVTPTRIVHKASDPVYISMVPGPGQHFIKEVRLVNDEPLKWIQNFGRNYDSSNDWDIGVSKGFFIGKIEPPPSANSSAEENSEKGVLEDVAFIYGPAGFRCAYRKGDDYFIVKGGKAVPISPFVYAYHVYTVSNITAASIQGARAATAGQQDRVTFVEALAENGFAKKAGFDLDQLKSASDNELEQIFDQFVHDDDKINFLFWLVDLDPEAKNALITKLLQKGDFSPDIKSYRDINLLLMAIARQNIMLAKGLVEKGAKYNTKKMSIFNAAVESGDISLVSMMIDRNQNVQGETLAKSIKNLTMSLLHADDNVEMATLLLNNATEDQLKIMWEKYPQLLKGQLLKKNHDMVRLFLSYGADPNVGDPRPLFYAVWGKDVELTRMLLEKGADPLLTNRKDQFLLNDCLLCTTEPMVGMVLNAIAARPDVEKSLNNVLLKALDKGNIILVDKLLAAGAKITTEAPLNSLVETIEKFEKIQDYTYIDRIFRLMPNDKMREHVAKEVGKPSLIYHLIEEGVLGENVEKPSPLFMAIRRNDIHQLQALLAIGEDPLKQNDSGYGFPLDAVIANGSPEAVTLLMNAYHDNLPVNNPKHKEIQRKILKLALERENPRILRDVLRAGGTIHPGMALPGTFVDNIKTFIAIGEFELVKQVLSIPSIQGHLIDFLEEIDDPKFTRYLIAEGVLGVNTTISRAFPFQQPVTTTLFNEIYKGFARSPDITKEKEYRELLDWVLANGGKITEQMFKEMMSVHEYVFNGVYGDGGGFIREWLGVMIQHADQELVQKFLPDILCVKEISLAQAALSRGVEINGTAAKPLAILSMLSQRFQLEDRIPIIKWAIDQGVDVNRHGSNGQHPFVDIVSWPIDEETIRLMIGKGMVLTEEETQNALSGAFKRHGVPMMNLLKSMGYTAGPEFWKDKVDLLYDAHDHSGIEALKYAVEDLGIEVTSIPIRLQWSILSSKDVESLRYLLERAKGPINLTFMQTQLNQNNDSSEIALVVQEYKNTL